MLKITPILLIVLVNSAQCQNMDWFYTFLNKEISNNPECNLQKNIFVEALENRESWALKMLDASGRLPRAIAQGNRRDEGTYDQCVNIQTKLNATEIKGKYCYGGLAVPLSVLNITLTSVGLGPVDVIVNDISQNVINDFNFDVFPRKPTIEQRAVVNDEEIDVLLVSVCLPSACSPSDLFDQLGVDALCQTKNQNKILDAGDIACLIFLILVLILLIASTFYDLYLRRHSQGARHPIFLAFSIITNGSKIITTTQNTGHIEFFNGLRVLSMFWIIMGHRCAVLDAFVMNHDDVDNWKKNWYSFYVMSAHLAVDTFLFISGVLLSNLFLKTMSKPKQKFNVFLYYLHRYLRLTPAVAVLYLAQITVVRRIASGPLYTYFIENVTNPPCIDYWWAFFLYIQNYIARDNMCLLHTWYLSMDMQFFIISPLLLLPMLHYGKKITYILIPVLVCLATIYTMVLFNTYSIKVWTDDYYQLYYYASHNRLPAWLIGLIFGAFLLDYQNNKNKFQIRNKLIVTLLWTAVVALITFLLLIQNNVEYEHTTLKATFYFPLLRPTFTLCLCWFSYACFSGNAYFINQFLSLPIFQVLSRITYSTYLVHITLILMHVGYERTSAYFDEYEMIRVVMADICLSYFVGALWTLAFESPMIVLEKILFATGKEQKTKNDRNSVTARAVKHNV